MSSDRTNKFKVGITVVISLFILLYGLVFLKDLRLGIETNELVVYFQDVNGLKEGDQVGVNGVPKGKVKTIELEGDSCRVSFTLSKDVVLKRDYVISVAMIELMSGKQIAIKPGRSSELADISKPLIGSKSEDVVTLIGTMNEIGDQIKDIAAKLNLTMDKLDVSIDNINELTGDEGLKSNIRSTASNFNEASNNLNEMLIENRSSLRSLTTRLNSIADNFDSTIVETKPELKNTISDIRDLTARVDSLTENLNELVQNAKDTNSTVGKLITNDEFYNNLNKTVLSINKLVKKIETEGIRLRLF
jgi:phospholipid/cholesterol/gamma-HCH transport system substrate-binding protein